MTTNNSTPATSTAPETVASIVIFDNMHKDLTLENAITVSAMNATGTYDLLQVERGARVIVTGHSGKAKLYQGILMTATGIAMIRIPEAAIKGMMYKDADTRAAEKTLRETFDAREEIKSHEKALKDLTETTTTAALIAYLHSLADTVEFLTVTLEKYTTDPTVENYARKYVGRVLVTTLGVPTRRWAEWKQANPNIFYGDIEVDEDEAGEGEAK